MASDNGETFYQLEVEYLNGEHYSKLLPIGTTDEEASVQYQVVLEYIIDTVKSLVLRSFEMKNKQTREHYEYIIGIATSG